MKSAILIAVVMWSLVALKAMHDKDANAKDAPKVAIVQAETLAMSRTPAANTTAKVEIAGVITGFRQQRGR